MRLWSALWVLPISLAACSVKVSASDISLTAQISEASIKVTNGAFGGLQGGFQLDLALGSEANGATQVENAQFELQTEGGEHLADLSQAMLDPMFPIALNKGESKHVVFKLDGIGVDRTKACAGPVRIVGSVTDTLKAGSDPVQSGVITPDCS